MKILIACDKFKGTLTADQVCKAIEKGVLSSNPVFECLRLPLADGGDGTLQILQHHFDFNLISLETIDPLSRKINASYLSNNKTAFIELAEASGIALLHNSELDVLNATTIGTGLLVRHALENKHSEIVLALGGSCTNDVGLGIAYALGFLFLDKDDNSVIPAGGNLKTIYKIIPPKELATFQLTILCDVKNPLTGIHGAAHVFGPQKGANQDEVVLLDYGMVHIADLIEKTFSKSIVAIEGGGAAGGIAAGLFGMLNNVQIMSGFDFIAKKLGLVGKIKQTDYIITGEGKFDQTSLNGKVVGKLLEIGRQFEKPIIVLSGTQDISLEEIDSYPIYASNSIMDHAIDLNDAMSNGEIHLEKMAAQLKFKI